MAPSGPERRAHDGNRLAGVGLPEGGHHIGAGRGEAVDLQDVIGLGRVLLHRLARDLAVAARSDAAADHHRRERCLTGLPQIVHQLDRGGIDRDDVRGRVTEPRAPVGTCPPRRTLEDESPSGWRARSRYSTRSTEPAAAGLQRRVREGRPRRGRSSPYWKMRLVSMPPSVRNRVHPVRGGRGGILLSSSTTATARHQHGNNRASRPAVGTAGKMRELEGVIHIIIYFSMRYMAGLTRFVKYWKIAL